MPLESIDSRRLSSLLTTKTGRVLVGQEREDAIINLGLDPNNLLPAFDLSITFEFVDTRVFSLPSTWNIVRTNFVVINRQILPKDNIAYQVDTALYTLTIGAGETLVVGDKIFIDIRLAEKQS